MYRIVAAEYKYACQLAESLIGSMNLVNQIKKMFIFVKTSAKSTFLQPRYDGQCCVLTSVKIDELPSDFEGFQAYFFRLCRTKTVYLSADYILMEIVTFQDTPAIQFVFLRFIHFDNL